MDWPTMRGALSTCPSSQAFLILWPAMRGMMASSPPPCFSASSTSALTLFFRALPWSPSDLQIIVVSYSCRLMSSCLMFSWTSHSVVAMNLLAIMTPWAPRVSAAASERPSEMPPTVTTGMFTESAILGVRTMVVTSSSRGCPPSSNPAAYTPS